MGPQVLPTCQQLVDEGVQPAQPLLQPCDLSVLRGARRLLAPAGELFRIQPQIVLLLGIDVNEPIN